LLSLHYLGMHCSKLFTSRCIVDFYRNWSTKNLSSKFATILFKRLLSCICFQHKNPLYYGALHIHKQNQFNPQWKASLLHCIYSHQPHKTVYYTHNKKNYAIIEHNHKWCDKLGYLEFTLLLVRLPLICFPHTRTKSQLGGSGQLPCTAKWIF
jgi:hypothetical protein